MSPFENIKHLGIFSRSSQFLVVFIVSTGLKVMTQWYAEKQRLLDLSGMDIAGSLNKNTLIIFTTAYKEYAVEGFELDVVDYLLKPFDFNHSICRRF
jgi:DNA-binding LytR/AlgR family response regulator